MMSLPPEVRALWPWTSRWARVNGRRMHYIDEGRGPPVLLLHGNPTWGFLYRGFVAPLVAAGYRVIVPDMIGFGLSDKPAHQSAHSLDGHIADLVALVRTLALTRLTVVAHDWGGPTGIGCALYERDRIHALVLMSTWAWALPPAEFHTRIFPWRMMHAPVAGPWLMQRHAGLVARGMALSVVDRARFRHEAQFAYEAVLVDPDDRLLTLVWPRWIPLHANSPVRARFDWLEAGLATVDWPVSLIWGREDDVFDAASFTSRFKRLLPQAEGPHLVTGRHFLQEDSTPEIVAHILTFLGRHPPAEGVACG